MEIKNKFVRIIFQIVFTGVFVYLIGFFVMIFILTIKSFLTGIPWW